MKSSSHIGRFIPFLAITFAAVSAAHATTTLSNVNGTWSAGGTLTDGKVVASGQASFNSVTIGRGVTNLSGNVAVGVGSLSVTTGTGNYMTALGFNALKFNTSGHSNTAVGHAALEGNTTATDNTSMGTASMRVNTSGSMNTAVGSSALWSNTTAVENSAVGAFSLNRNTTGDLNSGFGTTTLYLNTTGYYNTALGGHALYHNATGSNNVAIGMNAGIVWANGTTPLSDAWSSIYIGAFSRGKDDGDDNSIVIGTGAIGEGANTTVIGTPATTTTHLFGQTLSNSLSVTGATQLNGTVTLAAPQGDVSMGIYGN